MGTGQARATSWARRASGLPRRHRIAGVAAVVAAGLLWLAAGPPTAPLAALPGAVSPAAAVPGGAVPGPPGAPSVALGSTSVTLAWSPAAANGSVVTSHRVQTLRDGDVVATTDVGARSTATITGLVDGVPYTFRVAGTNELGTGAYSPPSDPATPRPEFVRPRVVERFPAPGATVVDARAKLRVRFSEPVTGWSTRNITVTEVDGSGRHIATVRGTTSYDAETSTGTFDPFGDAATVLGRDYRFRVRLSPEITDAAGNRLDRHAESWEFTVGPAPSLTARSPRPGATGVGGAARIRVDLSENVRQWSPRQVLLQRLDDDGRAFETVPGTTSWSARRSRATFYPFGPGPARLEPGTTYRVTLQRVTDLVGNPMPDTSWTFRTGDP